MTFTRAVFVLVLGLLALSVRAAENARPNIIVILADDLGYGDTGPYGQRRIATPSLDRLASQGTTFTSAYAGSTVCAPSRYVLLTGKHTGHAGVRGNAGREAALRYPAAAALQPSDRTVGAVLKDAGYATGVVGKWGLGEPGPLATGLPARQGFDYFFGYLNQGHAHNSYPSYLWRNEEKVPLANIVPNEGQYGTGVSSNKVQFSQDLFIDEALGFIRRQQGGPFFLYFAPTLPHANNESKPVGLEVPSKGRYANEDWPETAQLFAAMVTRLDRDIGRILDLLNELGLERNTLVVFASDNGAHAEGGQDPAFFGSSGPLRGIKRDLYEGGIRIPAIARWPGRIPAGARSDTPWYFADLLPTLAAVAKVEAPPTDGVNVWSAFAGVPVPELAERPLYWEFYERGFAQAARQGDWKAVRIGEGGPIELFNLRTDIGETRDVAAQNPEIVARFEALFRSEHGASPFWPIPSAPVQD